MSARRRGTALEQAKKKEDERRAKLGVTPQTVVTVLLTAERLLRVFSPATEGMFAAELRRFAAFVNDSLLTTEEGTRQWNEWAGGKSVEAILESTDESAPEMTESIGHGYAYYRCAGMRGKIAESPSLESVEQAVEVFWDAYHRTTRIRSDPRVRTSMIAFCKTTLKDKFGLHLEKKPRRVPDRAVLLDIITTLLSPDIVNEFTIHRIYTLLALNFQVASGSRVGAILRSSVYSDPKFAARAICWKDLEIWLFPGEPGSKYNKVEVRFKLRFTKTATGVGRRYDMLDGDVPAFWGATMLLTLAVAEGVIEGHHKLDWLLDPEIMEGRRTGKRVTIKDSWMETPVFRQSQVTPAVQDESATGSLTLYLAPGIAWRATKYDKMLKDACHKAGYPTSFASHDLRVLAVMSTLADPDIRVQDVQFSIGHQIMSDKFTKYMNNTASVNFQAAILGQGTTSNKLRELSYMKLEQDQELPTSLTPQSRSDLYDEPELVDLRLRQRALKKELVEKYGRWRSASAEEQENVEDLYLDYRVREQFLYRVYLEADVKAHLEKTRALPEKRDSVLNNLRSVTVDGQLDSMPAGEGVDYDLDITAAVLAQTDFTMADSLIRLLAGDGDAAETITLMQQVITGGNPPAPSLPNSLTSGPQPVISSGNPPAPSLPNPLVITDDLIDPSLRDPGPSASTPSVISGPPPAPSVTLPPVVTYTAPRLKKSQVQRTKAAKEAETRARSLSIASESSSSAQTSSNSSFSCIDADYADSTAHALDVLAMLVLDPSADRLDFFQRILALPPKTSHISGWWPGLTPVRINGEDCCPRCKLSVGAIAGHYKGLVPAAKLSKMRKHVFDCTAKSVMTTAMPALLASFDQKQPCPVCLARQDPKECLQKEKARTPKQWYNHLKVAHRAGDLCECGEHIDDNLALGSMHLATKHNILASNYGGNAASAPLGQNHFPTPQFSLHTYHFYPDPREWECHQRARFGEYMAGPNAIPIGRHLQCREDVRNKMHREGLVELDKLVPIEDDAQGFQDGRFQMISVDFQAKVVTKYGYCLLCAHDPRLTYTDRLHQFTQPHVQRKHVMSHMFNYFVGRNLHPYVCLNVESARPAARITRIEDDEDEDDEEDEEEELSEGEAAEEMEGDGGVLLDRGQTSWRDFRFQCPDPSCAFHRLSLSLRQLSNHAFIHHRAWDASPPTESHCISANDDDFVANFRILMKNVDIGLIAHNAGFPMEEEDGLEIVREPVYRPKRRLDGVVSSKRAPKKAKVDKKGKKKE